MGCLRTMDGADMREAEVAGRMPMENPLVAENASVSIFAVSGLLLGHAVPWKV